MKPSEAGRTDLGRLGRRPTPAGTAGGKRGSSAGTRPELPAARARELKPLLDALRVRASVERRVEEDPVSLVRAYGRAEDQEVAGLFCASLAYGRVDLFKPILARLLRSLGPSPSDFCRDLRERRDFTPFVGLVYRFNLGADLACLAWAIGEAQRTFGSLEGLFLAELARTGDLKTALAGFTEWLRGRDFQVVKSALGPPRALAHLLPDARRGGASKRLLLYLRWMARGPDEVDLGAWRGLSPRQLIIPVDTHVSRMSRNLGLTRRRDLSWRTAEEITASLRLVDPNDPVSYDFALCHFGMSGACPARRVAVRCARCELFSACQPGQRLVRLKTAQGERTVRSAPRSAAGKSTPRAVARVRAKVSNGSGPSITRPRGSLPGIRARSGTDRS